MVDSILLYVQIVPIFLLFSLFAIGLIIHGKDKLFVGGLGLLLLGYLVTGKGIAYLGVAPLYISEIILALGCLSVLLLAISRGRLHIGAINHLGAFTLFLFMLWGAARTFPYLPTYGVDALRDGVIWGYGLIAFCVALLVSPSALERWFGYYGRLLPFFLLALVLANLLMRFASLPSLPGSPVPIIYLKSGDAGVHLAGAGAFLLMRLDRVYGKPYTKWQLWLMWALWGIAWLLYGATGRGGMLSALLGIGVAFILRPYFNRLLRPAILLTILLMVLFVADLTGISQVNENVRRQLSFEQISTNVTSLIGGPSRADQEGTVEWRMMWWRKIVRYTLGGEYFWDGKGFGVNIAIDDGFPSPPGAPPNRHPHNITMNILARSGLPGLVLWAIFLLTFGWRLFSATGRQGYAGKTATWLLAYWLAFLFNAQVDVFLEGPMGGIWFWALVGASWVFVYRVPKWHSETLALPQASYAIVQSTPHR